jgi:excisionase family DNA binding protein
MYMNILTTKEAGDKLGITVQRIHALIKNGRLPAQKMGRDYFIKESDLKLVENRKAGRPSKQIVEQKKSSNKSKPKS